MVWPPTVRNFSHVCAPILNTIKGGIKCHFKWTVAIDQGFEMLKRRIAEMPTLRFPNFNQLFVVECDASKLAIGAILSQEGHPVDFFLEKLNEDKKKYSTYELELYAMVQALKKWRH